MPATPTSAGAAALDRQTTPSAGVVCWSRRQQHLQVRLGFSGQRPELIGEVDQLPRPACDHGAQLAPHQLCVGVSIASSAGASVRRAAPDKQQEGIAPPASIP